MALESVTVVPPMLTPSGSRRRVIGDCNSPEFEFWNNTSFPQPNDLLSADELFSDGFLLPLRLLNESNSSRHRSPPPPTPEVIISESNNSSDSSPLVKEAEAAATAESAELSLSVSLRLTSSKRWMDIFKKTPNSSNVDAAADGNCNNIKEMKKRDKIKNGGLRASSELNISLWPFTRSKSAGNDVARPPAVTRKVSSAPCSRSNSAGESKSKKWGSSCPSRSGAGVHLGRSSPVWQVRRGGARTRTFLNNNSSKGARKDGNIIEVLRRKTPAAAPKPGVLSFNVPMCIGYRPNHLNCESYEIGSATAGVSNAGEAVYASATNLFNFRSLFTKKVH